MDQNKSAPGQGQAGNQGQQNQGQRQGSPGNQSDQSKPNVDRDPAEGARQETRGNTGGQERGTGKQGEKNSSGISNRGMSESDEQADLPSRGSSSDDSSGQSER